MQRHRYDDEYKDRAVALAARPGASVAGVARELGISPDSLHKWIKARGGGTSAGEEIPQDLAALQLENQQLRQRLREVEEERELLVKATAFFARRT